MKDACAVNKFTTTAMNPKLNMRVGGLGSSVAHTRALALISQRKSIVMDAVSGSRRFGRGRVQMSAHNGDDMGDFTIRHGSNSRSNSAVKDRSPKIVDDWMASQVTEDPRADSQAIDHLFAKFGKIRS